MEPGSPTNITPTTQARQIDLLLAKYSESHLNPTNELIHCVCVPAIVLSFLGLIWAAHPLAAVLVTVISLVYYMSLSISFAVGMLAMSASMLWILSQLPQQWVWQISLGIFVVAWIGQFIGHKIEGKKPSFFDDLRFLLIGPLFVLGVLYRRLRIAY
ncbi:DUF962 domain-containing protein [Undibacterium sp. Ji49W]|uniref:Mpo1 family 2-hydroxy fatty acid dioxygenase n=1 Tax=Undibacterium sp. Ji49W TaxID=3413040 RepID=UPI003BF4316E